MATGGLYGNASESVGLYGNTTNFGGSYFEWFIFYQSDTQPATPTGGSWSFVTNTGTAPAGWSTVPFPAPTLPVWVSIALVNSRSDVPLVWSAPGLFSYSSGLPILSGSGTPAVGDGINSQLYVQTSTTPQTIWFKQSGTWNRLVGSTLYADLTTNQTVAGIKTFSSPIVGSVTGTSDNVTGIVAIANGGTSSTTASGARSALGVTATGQDTTYAYRANNLSDLASASTARTNLGLGSAAVLTAGAANGVATLDAGGTVPLSQIPASIQGGVSYQGTWNASTNTPTLTSSVGTKGYYYVVSTAGSTNLNGITSWNIGDWAIYNGTAWEKIDNTDAVTSVNGYTGTVVLAQTDIAGTASLTTVQTLTNKTLTSPKINEILDTNGNEILGLSPTASATDFVTIKNGIGVGVPLHVYADGPSTNIGLHIQPKGSGLVTISDGTDFNKGIRFRSSGSAASAVTLLDAVATAGRVVTLPDATTTLVGRDTTDTLTNKTIAFGSNTFSGTLGTTNGGTGLSSFTSGGVVYASSSSALATGSALTYDGIKLQVNTSVDATAGLVVKTFGAAGGIQPIANFQRSDAAISLQIGYNGNNGDSFFGTTTNHNLYFISNNTEIFRATSSSLYTASGVALIVGGSSAVNVASGRGNITIDGSSNSILNFAVGGVAKSYIFQNAGNLIITNLASAGGALLLENNGAERVRITSAGNVQLSTDSTGLLASDGYTMLYQTTAAITVGATNRFLQFACSASANAMTLTNTGNLVIGDTTAGARLSVVKAITGGNIGTSFQQELVNNNSVNIGDWTGTVYRWLTGNANSNQAYIGAVLTNVNVDTLSDLVFGVKNTNSGNTIVEAMRIKQGNVGIGTNDPDFSAGGDRILNITGTSVRGSLLLVNTSTGTTGVAGSIKAYNGSTFLGSIDFQAAGATNSSEVILYTKNAGTLNETAKFTSTGSIQSGNSISVGGATPTTSGIGITFPATQSASSNANTLDDYEQGTWPVGLTAGTSGTITTNTETGSYTKIGRQVTVNGFITVASVSSPVGLLRMTGLPFPQAGGRCAVSIWPHSLNAAAVTSVVGFITGTESTIVLYVYTAGNGANDMASYVQAGTNLCVSATYFAAD